MSDDGGDEAIRVRTIMRPLLPDEPGPGGPVQSGVGRLPSGANPLHGLGELRRRANPSFFFLLGRSSSSVVVAAEGLTLSIRG